MPIVLTKTLKTILAGKIMAVGQEEFIRFSGTIPHVAYTKETVIRLRIAEADLYVG
jgi:hypothetical protein